MSDNLQQLLREAADRIDVPPPPTSAILAGGRRRQSVRRTQGFLAVAASVVVVVGGVVGVSQLLSDDTSGTVPAPADTPTPSATLAGGPLDVSGSGVGEQPFGTAADEVVAAVTARFGEPDLSVGPQRYAHVAGSDAWFEDGQDPLSPSWKYQVTSVACWDTLCLIFGGDSAGTVQLRGWELAQYRRWAEPATPEDPQAPDVRLAGTGIRLGDTWKRLHAAYPDTTVQGGEGASVTVRPTPWAGVSDGVGAWRLSGQWDYNHPNKAPAGAVVTRLSGGEGPEPGCC